MKFFFIQPNLGKGWLFSFILPIHRFCLALHSALRGVIRQPTPVASASLAAFIPSAEIITFVIQNGIQLSAVHALGQVQGIEHICSFEN